MMGRELFLLLSDIAEGLAGEESNYSQEAEMAPKMQKVLLSLISMRTRYKKPKERELVTVVNLVNLAMQRLPAAFTNQECSTALALLSQLTTLLVDTELSDARVVLLKTMTALLSLTAKNSRAAFSAISSDIIGLLSAARHILSLLCRPAELPAEPTFRLQSAFPASAVHMQRAAQRATIAAPAQPSPKAASQTLLDAAVSHADAPNADAPPSILIGSMQECQQLCAAVFQVAAHCITIAPCTVKAQLGPAELSITLDLLKGGGWTIQTAALAFMCRAIDVVQPDAVGAEAIVAALVEAWTAWQTWQMEIAADPLLPMWLSSMHGCIEWLAAHFYGDVLEPLVVSLAATATGTSVDTKCRAWACMLLCYIAPKSAAVKGEALRLVRGLHLNLPASAVLHQVVMHLTDQLGEKTLAGLVQEVAALDVSRPQTASGSSPAAKKQRLTGPDASIDLCSPDKGQISQQPGSTQQPLGQPTADQPARKGLCADLLRELMAQGDVVSPSAQGGLSPHARLQLLQGLIVSVGTSLPPLLARWAPTVGEWVRWCLSPVGSADTRLQDVALVTGCVDAFYAACIAMEANAALAASAVTPSRSSSAHHLKAKQLAHALGLTKEQVKALAGLPFSSHLGLDDAFSPGTAEVLEDALLRRATKAAALRVQLAAYLFDMADGGNPFSRGNTAAKGLANDDPAIRALAAGLVPSFIACTQRHTKALQSGVAALQNLADSPEPEVKLAVALALPAVIRGHALRQHKALAAFQACARSAALVEQTKDEPSSWKLLCPEAPPSELAAGAPIDLTAEELAGFAEKLLLLDNLQEKTQVAMLKATTQWFAVAPAKDIAAARSVLIRSLQLGAHPSAAVRMELVRAAGTLARQAVIWAGFGGAASDPQPEDRDAYLKAEARVLQDLKALRQEQHEETVQITLLWTIAAVGSCMQGDSAQQLVMTVLIWHLQNPQGCLKAVAWQLLQGYAAAKQTTLTALILESEKQVLMEFLGVNILKRPDLLGEVGDLLGMEEEELAVKCLPAALARLTADEDKLALQALADKAGMPLPEALQKYGYHVVAKYLFEGGSSVDFERFMGFMEQLMGVGFMSFLAEEYIMQEVIAKLVELAGQASDWGHGVSVPEAVLSKLQSVLPELAKVQHHEGGTAAFLADSDRITRILKMYGGDTVEKTAAAIQGGSLADAQIRFHRQMLRSLLLLVHLTAGYVTRFLPQMMVLLSSSVGPGVPDTIKLQSLEAWHTLVLALAKHAPSQLASVINQVVVTLLEPLREGGAVLAAAARVLDAVIVDHGHLVKHQIKALPPLPPSAAALGRVTAAIARERGRLTQQETIQLLLRSLSHPALSVRATTLQELRDYLNGNRRWLASLLAGSSSAASQDGQVQHTALLSSLVSTLLMCCDSEANDEVGTKAQLLCAECLGLLGAVDPARLSVKTRLPEELYTEPDDLLIALISKHLARLLRVAPSLQVLDSTTFAIQELLRHYGEPDAEASRGATASPGRGNTLFAVLPKDVQALVQPYLDSKFTITGPGVTTSGIVFTTSGIAFHRWLHTWLRQLVNNHATGALLALFQACGLVMRRDVQTGLFLMPYIIHNVLQAGSNAARTEVKQEIHAVLTGGRATKEGELCVQAIFSLLDVLKKFVSSLKAQAAQAEASGHSRSSRVSSPAEAELHTRHITDLISSIPMDLLAQAAFHCGAHARALQYFETCVRAEEKGGLNPAAHYSATYRDDDVTFLQEIYGKLEEPDGLTGLMRLRSGEPLLQDQILAAEKMGCWDEANALYEHNLHTEAGRSSGLHSVLSSAQRGKLQCLLQMGHLQTMLAMVDGLSLSSDAVALPQLATIGIAGAWRLGRWDLLKRYLGTAAACQEVLSSDEVWEMRIGKLLSSISSRERVQTAVGLDEDRKAIMAPLSAASIESYTRAYPYLVKLHMLQELADAAFLLQEGSVAGEKDRQRRLKWEERLQVTQSSLAVQEPILALRRQLAVLSGAGKEASLCWLQHAQLCRATGHYEAAATAILQAEARHVPGSSIEFAKLQWDMGQPQQAISKLQQELLAFEQGTGGGAHVEDWQKQELKSNGTQILLQLARWKATTGQGAKSDVTALFKRAIDLEAQEECYFHFARYLDQLMQDAMQRQAARGAGTSKPMDRIGGKSRILIGEDQPFVEYVADVIRNYGSSVQHGHRHIYQSVPRLLTVWFEFGTHCVGITGKPSKQERQAQTDVQAAMQKLSRELPQYAWLVALPQLTSRICHPHQPTQDMVQHILTRLTGSYPQQALWALAAVSKSQVTARNMAASTILRSARKAETDEGRKRLYSQFPAFCDQLIRLCHHNPGDKHKTMSAKSDMGQLVRMMPLDVLVPVNATLGLVLPAGAVPARDHTPFSDFVTIHGMRDRIEVMTSLQKPKKIVFLGSNGKEYPFLVKPDDDLRKDSRMMETAGLLNRLFAEDPVSRRRNLYIRRFAVTPLTENCGLIEWVIHTTGLRQCCQAQYAAAGRFNKTTNPTVKTMYEGFKGKRMADLMDKVLAMFPPMLHNFFQSGWPEPASWFNARLAFTRTAAVWSMVGHVLGLGDRHGENILVDTVTGDCLHIDFACLFDKGLTLAKPELVPFRLTQNVVDAFGVSGHEGVFRRVSEITLRVLREHRDTLASVLETFVHDPLVDWTGHGRGSAEDGTENPQARDAMLTIEGRLNGKLLGVRSIPSLQLSVEGQVDHLIEEATSKEHLGQMYIWWMAWF